MGLASLPSSWTVLYHLSFVEKFAKKITSDHKSIRKWSARSVLETLQEKERADPVGLFLEQTVKVIWQNASSPELSNKHQDITRLVVVANVVPLFKKSSKEKLGNNRPLSLTLVV
eukprot:g40845.t1